MFDFPKPTGGLPPVGENGCGWILLARSRSFFLWWERNSKLAVLAFKIEPLPPWHCHHGSLSDPDSVHAESTLVPAWPQHGVMAPVTDYINFVQCK